MPTVHQPQPPRVIPFCGKCGTELMEQKWGLICIVCGLAWPPLPEDEKYEADDGSVPT